MQGIFKSENIVVTNGTTRCKTKQGHKIVFFNSNTLIEFTKVSYKFLRNKESYYLLNSRTKPFMIHYFICILFHYLNHAIYIA